MTDAQQMPRGGGEDGHSWGSLSQLQYYLECRKVPRKTWVLENFGSFSCDFASWSRSLAMS